MDEVRHVAAADSTAIGQRRHAALSLSKPAGRLRHGALVCLALAGLAGPAVLRAEEGRQAIASPTPAAAVAISVADIPTRAESTAAELRELQARLGEDPEVAGIGASLPALGDRLQRADAIPLEATSGLTIRDLEDVGRLWMREEEVLAGWADVTSRRTQTIEVKIASVRELDEIWGLTAKAAAQEALPEAVLAQITATRATIRDTLTRLRDQRDGLLTLASRIGALQTEVTDRLAEVDAATVRLRREFFVAESPPLWSALSGLAGEPIGETARLAWRLNARQLTAFVRAERARFAAQAVLFVVLVAVTFGVRRRTRDWPADDESLAQVHALTDQPLSAALVLTVVLAISLHPNDPALVSDLSALLLVVPLIRLLRNPLPDRPRVLFPTFAALFVVGSVRRMLPAVAPVARLLLVVENVGVAIWILSALGAREIALFTRAEARRRLPVVVGRVMLALLAVVLVANLVGNLTLAVFLSRGVLGSIFVGSAIYATSQIVEGLVVVALRSPSAQRLRSIVRHATILRRRAFAAVRLAALLLWLAGMLLLFGVLEGTLDLLATVLAARLRIGAMSISPGDIVAFALTIWVALLLARIARVVLEDDVLPHMELPRGVPSAVSTAANYTILLFGLFFAMSAAGLDLGRLTLLAGAFGVGIGFGLQNVVNNFVSGLILLFERPVRVGDVVEVGAVTGSVSHIGIRSSTIRTFEGAEVIVPNGSLIAEQLTNWTFSDYQRRLEIKVGVTYGTDPQQVLTLLERVAAEHADVLKDPPPQALFLGFGDSSLDFALRAWTMRFDLVSAVRSDLAVAVHRALREAGIEIPFPQRDLHLRSVDPAVGATLSGPKRG